MNTNFSFHAFKRINSRISLSHSDLAEIIDADLVVNTGCETNSNRAHKLFYSERDGMCFVAIQDVKTGTVITVLPLDYHQKTSWVVSVEAQNRAKKVIAGKKPNKHWCDEITLHSLSLLA